jgi:hypothetical protein
MVVDMAASYGHARPAAEFEGGEDAAKTGSYGPGNPTVSAMTAALT